MEHEEEVRNLKVEVEELRGKLKMAKLKPVISPEVTGKIIEDDKASKDFVHEVIEGSTDGFCKGFELCRSQIQSLLPDFDISCLKEFFDDDEAEAEVEAEVEV